MAGTTYVCGAVRWTQHKAEGGKEMKKPVLVVAFTAAVLCVSVPGNCCELPHAILELETEVPGEPGFPGNCSTWFELWPNNGDMWHQDGYEDLSKLDNGDGQLSACDLFVAEGITWHVLYVVPTFLGSNGCSYEPIDVANCNYVYEPGDPTCQTWTQHTPPNIMEPVHIGGWTDGDDDGVVSNCDQILVGGQWIHITGTKVNMAIQLPPNPAEQGAWSQIKSFFTGIFQ